MTSTAVVGLNQVGEITATLAIAWIETFAPEGGQKYDRLSAAEVTCVQVTGGE